MFTCNRKNVHYSQADGTWLTEEQYHKCTLSWDRSSVRTKISKARIVSRIIGTLIDSQASHSAYNQRNQWKEPMSQS